MRDKKKKTIKVRDLKPTKDAKGGVRAMTSHRTQGNTRQR